MAVVACELSERISRLPSDPDVLAEFLRGFRGIPGTTFNNPLAMYLQTEMGHAYIALGNGIAWDDMTGEEAELPIGVQDFVKRFDACRYSWLLDWQPRSEEHTS